MSEDPFVSNSELQNRGTGVLPAWPEAGASWLGRHRVTHPPPPEREEQKFIY